MTTDQFRINSALAPAPLFTVAERRELFYRTVNVSKRCLELLVAEELEPESVLVFSTGGRELELRIAGRTRTSHDPALYRYGLVALADDADMEEMFFVQGCLEENLEGKVDF